MVFIKSSCFSYICTFSEYHAAKTVKKTLQQSYNSKIFGIEMENVTVNLFDVTLVNNDDIGK